MKNLIHDIKDFLVAVESQLPVVLNEDGTWNVLQDFSSTFKHIVAPEPDNVHLLKRFLNILISIESQHVLFPLISKTLLTQNVNLKNYLLVAEKLLEIMSKSFDEETVKHTNRLKRHTVALSYRLEEINGGLSRVEATNESFESIATLAVEWKHNKPFFVEFELTPYEFKQIETAAQYPKFVNLILNDADLRENFFLWALRDKSSVEVFVEFPVLQERLYLTGLSQRNGRFGGNALKMSKISFKTEDYSVAKIVTLPIEGVDVDLLDDSKVIHFKKDYSLTIKEIFNIFENKNRNPGNLEFLNAGITSWNPHKLGHWNAAKQDYDLIDLGMKNWWKQLPCFELVSAKVAGDRYGVKLDGTKWVLSATATRGTKTLDFENTHAYLELAIPQGDHTYEILSFGKFGTFFPTTFYENITSFCQTMYATVAFPDENEFYSHRHTVYHPFLVDAEEGLRFMESIKKDIQLSREGNFVYQIESDNCAKWTQEKLENELGNHRVPNLYKMSLLDTEPQGFVSNIFDLIKKLPRAFQVSTLTAMHYPFGAWKGHEVVENGKRVTKNLINHSFWDTAEVYLPALLHHHKASGSF
jgi:hypothetical protein